MQNHHLIIAVPSRFARRPIGPVGGSRALRFSLLACLLVSLTLAWGSAPGSGRMTESARSGDSIVVQPLVTAVPARETTAEASDSSPLDRIEPEATESPADARTLRRIFTPSIMPTAGRLSSSFGYRRDPVLGERRFHRGLDISASPGEPVLATADGVVTRAGLRGGLGRSVSITHGYGLVTTYSHLASLGVTEGEEVRRGETIGRVGISGRATGYHLHYEVFDQGRPVDPLAYLPSRPRS